MAHCPKCKAEMSGYDVTCPSCGYDFFHEPAAKRGWVYGKLPAFSLIVGQVLTGFLCLVCPIWFIAMLARGDWLDAMINAPLTFLFSFALFVTFARVRDMY